jgi:hypothetical protein
MKKALNLIFVSEGESDGILWIELDGDEESLNPSRVIEIFPELASSSISNEGKFARPKLIEELSEIRMLMQGKVGLIVDTPTIFRIYTIDKVLHMEIFEKAKEYLPE